MRKLERPEYVKIRLIISSRLSESGMSQRELSGKLGMPSSYINKILAGQRTIEITELVDILIALNLTLTDLDQLLR
ncbi:MAG: helix-turn-helix transcriptional regulator [Armatimonadetes bacterium]|nr:helix-turn-helix transcriptional regulator [Armatimonadota bacterium]